MTVETKTAFTADEFTIGLKCVKCGDTLLLSEREPEFYIREKQDCPSCGAEWWTEGRGRKPGFGVDSDPACNLIDAIRRWRDSNPQRVIVKLIVEGPCSV